MDGLFPVVLTKMPPTGWVTSIVNPSSGYGRVICILNSGRKYSLHGRKFRFAEIVQRNEFLSLIFDSEVNYINYYP
jgi:hypothetical protein